MISSTPGMARSVCSAARSAGCSQVIAAISGKRCRGRRAGTLEFISGALPHGLVEVGQKIVNVFDSAAQPDEAVGQAHGLSHDRWDRSVRHRGWMAHQTLDSSERLGQHKDPGAFHKAPRSRGIAQIERHHPAETAHLPAGNFVLRVRWQPWIVDLADHGLTGKPLRDPASVGIVLTHPERQGLDAPERQPAVHGTRNGTSRILDERKPLGHIVPRGEQQSPHHVAVTVEVFRGRVQHDIGSVLQRPLEVRRGEGVVHYIQVAMRLSQVSHRGQIGEVHHWVGWRLAVDHPGGWGERALDIPDLAHVHEAHPQSEVAVDPLHQAMTAAVYILAADDVIPGFEKLEHGIEGGQTRAEGKTVGGAFQAGDVSLEGLTGGVLGAGVLVPSVLAQAFLHVGRGLIDRRHDRTGQGLDDLSGMDGSGGTAVLVVVLENAGHELLHGRGRVKRNSRQAYWLLAVGPVYFRSVTATISDGASPRCLIVDDDAQVRQVLSRVIATQGLLPVEASSGADALAVLKRLGEIPICISDIYMPEMDGVTFLREALQRYPDMAVVMLTGMAEVNTAVECLKLGALDYISKPVIIEEVRARLHKALEKRRLVLENRFYQQMLEMRVQELDRKNRSSLINGVQTLVQALEAKDAYTSGHSSRVSRYATRTAVQLGFTDDAVEHIRLGGELHDIGKIGTREFVLNKPGPLTPEEFQHIMEHSALGEKILAPFLSQSPIVLRIARSHRERIDGSGFPDALRGNRIPLEARIVAVVDAFDAMTTNRAYRPQLPVPRAIDELR